MGRQGTDADDGDRLAAGRCRVREQGTYREIDVLPELEHLAGLPQNQRFHCYDVWEHTLAAVDNSPRQLAIRWALLLHDVPKGFLVSAGLIKKVSPVIMVTKLKAPLWQKLF